MYSYVANQWLENQWFGNQLYSHQAVSAPCNSIYCNYETLYIVGLSAVFGSKCTCTLSVLTLGGLSSTGVLSVLTSLSQGVTLPLPVLARCVVERKWFQESVQNSAVPSIHLDRTTLRMNESADPTEPAIPRNMYGWRLETDWNLDWHHARLRTIACRDSFCPRVV
jgi:hypothetical protein